MTVVEWTGRLLIIDHERVMLIPTKGEARELSKEETKCALRFLGMHKIPVAPRIVELANPLQDAPLLTEYQIEVLRQLNKDGDQMTVKAITNQIRLDDPQGSSPGNIANHLYKLERLDLVNRTKPESSNRQLPHLWQITTQGIDVLADHT